MDEVAPENKNDVNTNVNINININGKPDQRHPGSGQACLIQNKNLTNSRSPTLSGIRSYPTVREIYKSVV